MQKSVGKPASSSARAHILGIDVGGSGIKATIVDPKGKMLTERVRVKTPPGCKPKQMVDLLTELVSPLGAFSRIAVGFPGYVRDGKVFTAPNLDSEAWVGFDLAQALESKLKSPVRLVNDADMQGLAAIRGKGLELVCTLGTGFGTAWFRNGELLPHMNWRISHFIVEKISTPLSASIPAKSSAIRNGTSGLKR